MNCIHCGLAVNNDRVNFLVSDNKPITCTSCSKRNDAGVTGFMIFNGKTAPSLAIIENANRVQLDIARRANRRGR